MNEPQKSGYVYGYTENPDGTRGRVEVWPEQSPEGPLCRDGLAVFGWDAVGGFHWTWYWDEPAGVALAMESISNPAAYLALLDWLQENVDHARQWDGSPVPEYSLSTLRYRLGVASTQRT
jgi:hypothetical protein